MSNAATTAQFQSVQALAVQDQLQSDSSKSHILLIDDDPGDRELALTVFEELAEQGVVQNVCVVFAESGSDAMGYLTNAARPLPQVVLLDLNMPHMNGGAVLAAIRADKRTEQLPVVILSTSREPSDIASCYAQGASAYVVKSLDFGEFRTTLQSVIDFWLTQNRVPYAD